MLTKLIAKYHADAAYQIAEVYAFRNQSKDAPTRALGIKTRRSRSENR